MLRENPHRDGWSLLPHDILLWVNNYLEHEDRYACLHVCPQWYSALAPRFYTYVTILNSLQCTRLLSHLDTVGDGIRNLHVRLRTDDVEAWGRLARWHFPALQSLSVSVVDKRLLHNSASSYGMISSGLNRGGFHYTITSFVSLHPSLTYLDLSIPHLHIALLLTALKKSPGLLTLQLKGMSGYLTCADMDLIHESCPELRHIQISAEQFITQGRTLRGGNHQRHEGHEEEPITDTSEDLLLRLFPLDTSTQQSSRPVASKLVTFHVSVYRGLEEHMCDWFVYAARNYPSLESFSLEARPEHQYRVGDRGFEFDLLNMIMDYRWANAVWKQAELAAFHLFVRSCPHVKSLSVLQLYLNRNFLDIIFTCNLPITAFAFTMNIHSPWQVNHRNWFFSSTLVSLTLQACVTLPATNEMVMEFLGAMPHLRHLKLSRYEHFAMTTLLQHCLRLQTLTLEHMPLLNDDSPHLSSVMLNEEPDLHTIVIRHVIMNEAFFENITKGLKVLTLKDTAIIATETNGASMWVPHIDFESLVLDNLLVEDPSSARKTVKLSRSRRFSMFGVETSTSSCRWYDLSDEGNHRQSAVADERVLGVRPLSGRDADDTLEDNHVHGLHITCGSAQKIRINDKRLLGLSMC